MNSPKISILIPFYNARLTLERALMSIGNQTFSDFECILINNNSSDESIDIVHRYCEVDDRFSTIIEKRQGIVFALNSGLTIARGKYIARMDADDWSYPERLEDQHHFLNQHSEYGVIAGKAIYVAHKPETEGFERYVNWSNSLLEFEDIYLKQFIESPIIHPTVMWRKEVSDQFGHYASGNFPEDYELWLRWLAHGVKFHKLHKPVLKWFDDDRRLTRTDFRYFDESFFMIKTQYLAKWLSIHIPVHLKILVWGASKISRARANLLESNGIQIAGYIDITKKRKLDKQIIHYQDIPSPDKAFILVYLKEQTMRLKTVDFLEERGFREGKNFLLVS